MNAQLNRILHRWGWWLRGINGMTWGMWGWVAGLAAALALALTARFVPLLMARTLALITMLLALTGAAGGLAAALLWPRPRRRLVRIFDLRLGLAERLTTALEIGIGRLTPPQEISSAQLADTLTVSQQIEIRRAMPLQADRRVLLIALVLILGLSLSLGLPNPQEQVLHQRDAIREAVQQQIEELEEVREEIAATEGLTEEEKKLLLQALEEAIAALEEGEATPEEAVEALAEAERTLAELQDPNAAGVQAGLEQAAEGMTDSELTQDIAEALSEGNYQEAAEALAAYAGTEGEMLTREEELELAQELAEAAAALAESNPELAEKLAEAAAAIEQGNIDEARQAIQEAASQIAEAGELVEQQEAVEAALSALQEGREEIAEASGAQSSGQGGQQAGQQGGEQGGQQDGGQQAGTGQQAQPGHHEDSGSGAPYDEVYIPSRLEEEGTASEIDREGEGGLPTGDSPLPSSESGQASTPYREVYVDYADQAYAALEESYIPLGMKQYVRDYFSALEP